MNVFQFKELLKEKGYSLTGENVFNTVPYLRRHDVVFKSPMIEGFEGLPLGNGDMGCMIWTQQEGYLMQINKNDLWTLPEGHDPYLLRSAARIGICFDEPIHDFLYLSDFEARLNMADAVATFSGDTPFCKSHLTAWIDTDENVLYLHIQADAPGTQRIRIFTERYGSSGACRWYNNIEQETARSLGKAKARIKDQFLCVHETFDDSETVSSCVALGLTGCEYESYLVNQRRGEMKITFTDHLDATLTVALAGGCGCKNTVEEACALAKRKMTDYEDSWKRHENWWHSFWNKSFLHISDAEDQDAGDYAENLYYLHLYTMGASSRAKYPLMFNGGLFTWNRDVRQWGNPHHWNMQQSYFCMETANHGELLKPYIGAYFNMKDKARTYAKEKLGVKDGISISEMHDFRGEMLAAPRALTPAPQIAMIFWKHYLYNKDMAYLRETAYPFMALSAELYANMAKWNETTQRYDIGPCSVAESSYSKAYNSVVDGVMARKILAAALEANELLGENDPRADRWREVKDHLFDFIYIVGENADNDQLACGLAEDRKSILNTSNEFVRNATPVLPGDMIGSRDKGTRLYEAVKNAVLSFRRSELAIKPVASLMARLDMPDKALDSIYDSIDQLQHFRQGFFYNIDHWCLLSPHRDRSSGNFWGKFWGDQELAWADLQRDYVYDERTVYYHVRRCNRDGTMTEINPPSRPFVQCGFETMGLMADACQEVMMQNYEGFVRLCPGGKSRVKGMFTFAAEGGFLITSDAQAHFALADSKLGGKIRISLCGENITVSDGEKDIPYEKEDNILSFETEKGKRYYIFDSALTADLVEEFPRGYVVNDHVKTLRHAQIGTERGR